MSLINSMLQHQCVERKHIERIHQRSPNGKGFSINECKGSFKTLNTVREHTLQSV